MKNFINFHILISHSPSCLNRDDMNMQKSAVFGGVRRVRVSSQSLKRAMRKSEYYSQNLGKESIRSRSLELLKDEFLDQLGEEFSAEIIQEALDRFVKSKNTGEGVDQDSDEEQITKKIAVAPWVKEEFRLLCTTVEEIKVKGLTPEESEKAAQKHKNQKGKKN